ncbi:MAG TPA: glycosyltransferase family 2 protein [Chromatiaceae bacterium]|nr:glycosyltransferase family 2 protein [Chromatiaceae bacterium]HIO13677.1 glycosyltransferase family 2 protein [Chromatiales bacterium]
MTDDFRISAVIPAYNSAAFLSKAVASVRAQTCTIDEIIIVDDGSSDDTQTIAQTLGDDVRYFYQDNAGPSAARNLGVREARGEWIAFLDADDQWTPAKTERQLEALRRHPQLMLIAADMAEVTPQGDILVDSVQTHHGHRDEFEPLNGAPIANALRRLTQANFIPTGTVLARKEILLDRGLFDTEIRYGEDLLLWSKIAMTHPIACLGWVGMLRCKHGDNATGDTLPLLKDLTKVMSHLRDCGAAELQKQGVDPDQLVARTWADLGYWYFDQGDRANARSALRRSLNEHYSTRALVYAALSKLPDGLINQLRRVKQGMGSH